MNRYIVSLSGLSKEHEEEFSKYLTDKGAGYWHMITNFWLVSSHDNTVTKESIRTELQKNSSGPLIVLDVTNSAEWCGFGETKDFDWMKNNWDNHSV